jgi:beta-N-acetylglucosaminidase
MHTYASEVIVITGNSVRFRGEPTTAVNNIKATLDDGVELVLLDKNVPAGNGCGKVWYKGQYGSEIGYVCSEFADIVEVKEINPEDYTEYSEYLKELGFPEEYIVKLIELHAKHPNWQFRVMNSNIDFNNLVKLEYDGHAKGWSLIEDTGRYYDGYKSFDSWSYNYLTDVFSNDFRGGGDNWYAASKNTIAYYVDPRNFLDDSHIFMFENLGYNEKYHNKAGIELMLKGTFMESGYADVENQKTYADAFIDAALAYDVSPYVLVSRVIQEIGPKGSTIISGKVSGYEGYYNFYNINAAGNTASETIANGLKYAKAQGWNTHYKAIVGGASFLGDDYIAAGQDSLYLQKWDIIGSNIVNHQYMQNIQAPYHEAVKTYKGYNNAGLIESAFVFTIPVYKNMPVETKLPNKGNPNNYLSSLAVNGDYLFDKASTKTEFNLNLSLATTSIEISATKVSGKAVVSGTGTVSLSGEKQTIPIVVTAQNGDIRTYNINVTRTESVAIAVGEILRLLNIKNDGTYMYGFDVGMDISKIKSNIISKEAKAEVTSVDKNGKSKTSGVIASGDQIKIKTDSEEKTYTLIIYGDVNSDGKISSADYITIKNHIMDVTKLGSLEQTFADANKDGKVSSADYITIKNHIMDVKKIIQ